MNTPPTHRMILRTRRAQRARKAAYLLALLGATTLLGCNIAGPVIAVVAGPEGYQARYTLPKQRPTVVFVDDRANRVPTRSARELIGQTAERTLLGKGAVKDMIESRLALATLRGERFNEPMTIAQVGKAVQAEVVVYATVDAWSITPDGQTFAPQADLRVKVVDATTNQVLWPSEGSSGGDLSVRVPSQAKAAPTSSAGVTEAHLDLARWVGLRLAQMFYDHAPDEVPTKFSAEDRSRG